MFLPQRGYKHLSTSVGKNSWWRMSWNHQQRTVVAMNTSHARGTGDPTETLRWIGHTIRKPIDSTARKALTWNTEGNRTTEKHVAPRSGSCCQRNLMQMEIQLERLTQDRNAWRKHACGLCLRRDDEGVAWLIDWLISFSPGELSTLRANITVKHESCVQWYNRL